MLTFISCPHLSVPRGGFLSDFSVDAPPTGGDKLWKGVVGYASDCRLPGFSYLRKPRSVHSGSSYLQHSSSSSKPKNSFRTFSRAPDQKKTQHHPAKPAMKHVLRAGFSDFPCGHQAGASFQHTFATNLLRQNRTDNIPRS